MIKLSQRQAREEMISFAEHTLSLLSEEKYDDFLAMYDSSRISGEGLLLALRFFDMDSQAIKIDDPVKVKCAERRVDIGEYDDGSGFWMDYDLTTDGHFNDLTMQIAFLKQGSGYLAVLEDLRVL